MLRNKVCILFLAIGVVSGAFFGLTRAKATSPEGGTSAGEQPASVYYDEFWQATGAVVSTGSGYRDFNPASHVNTPVAGELSDGNVTIAPKLVIKKWTVHGHIHFE